MVYLLLLCISISLSWSKTYVWKFGANVTPQIYQYDQRSESIGDAEGSNLILQNIQLLTSRKLSSGVVEADFNYSSVVLKADGQNEKVSNFNFNIGWVYKHWIAQLQYEKIGLITIRDDVVSTADLSTYWLAGGYRHTFPGQVYKIQILAALPVSTELENQTVENASGYKVIIQAEYRKKLGLKKVNGIYFVIRPFIEHKHWDFSLKEQEGDNQVSVNQVGVGVGFNKFF